MPDEAIAKYLDEIPAEIRDAVSELSSPQRWAVFLAILKADRNFNELKRELGISAEQLDNILRRLVIGGLVYKEMATPAEIGDRKTTRYTITPSGNILVRSLLEGFLPESRAPEKKKLVVRYGWQNDEKLVVCEPRAISVSPPGVRDLDLNTPAFSLHEEQPAIRHNKPATKMTIKNSSRTVKTVKKNR